MHLAEAVTKTGQIIIQWLASDVNACLNRVLKTKEDYVVASDTDSLMCRFDAIAKMFQSGKPGATVQQTVSALDKFCKEKMEPLIARSLSDIATYFNVADPCLMMVRDVIADKGVFLAKKRYILNVWDAEGVRYNQAMMKVMGLEMIKSSTPAVCRDILKSSISIIINGEQRDLWSYLSDERKKFNKLKFEEVASPRSVNGLEKYAESEKGVPIHVRGALMFNEMLLRTGLDKEYEPIHEGEKIRFCYLRPDNKFGCHVLAASEGCPPEWDVEHWIDYEKQWQKSLIEPLLPIASVIGWTTEFSPTLFD